MCVVETEMKVCAPKLTHCYKRREERAPDGLRLGGGGAREILFRCEVEPQRMRASVDPVEARHVEGMLG